MTGVFLITILGVLIAIPIVSWVNPSVGDQLYIWQMEYQQFEQQRFKLWKFLILKVEPFISQGALSWLDNLLRLAGRPWGIRAVDLVTLQALTCAATLALSTQANEKVHGPMVALAFMLGFYPIWLLIKRKNKRGFEASDSIRSLKKRFYYEYRRGRPRNDVLFEIADQAAGEFGERFQFYMEQSKRRSMHAVMNELAAEFSSRELKTFCYAIAKSDERSPQILEDQLRRQIKDEENRAEEFIARKLSMTQGKIYTLIAIGVAWVLILCGIFFYYYYTDDIRGRMPFL